MKDNRLLREQQYAQQKERDWEESIRKEIELHRSVKAQYHFRKEVEMNAWRAAQAALAAEKRAQLATSCHTMAHHLVTIALKAAEYRESRGCNAPLREWRQWSAMFLADSRKLDPPPATEGSEGAIVSDSSEAEAIMNKSAVSDFLLCQGPWEVDPVINHNTEVATVVAEVANATRNSKANADDLPNLDLPLKLAVIGAPFSGKSAVSVHLADKYDLKLLTPEMLVLEAVQAADNYVPPEPAPAPEPAAPEDGAAPEEGAEEGAAAPEPPAAPEVPPPPKKVQLGQEAKAALAVGDTVSDAVVVQLVAIAINEAHEYVPPKQEAAPPPAAKGKASATGAPPPVEIPKPQGIVLDGFPRTEAQASQLEKALTALDLEAERNFIAQVSAFLVVGPCNRGSGPCNKGSYPGGFFHNIFSNSSTVH